MANIENGDVLRIGATMSYENVFELTNVYHCLVTGGGDKAFSEIIDDIQEYMDAIMADIDTLLLDECRANYLSVANPTQGLVFGSIEWGAFAQGGASADPTAVGVCCLGYARTLAPRVQIRKYYGVFAETQMAAGLWSSAVRTAIVTLMGYHILPQTMTDGLVLMGVAFNRTLKTYQLGQSVTTSAEPTYQRRRRRGRGS